MFIWKWHEIVRWQHYVMSYSPSSRSLPDCLLPVITHNSSINSVSLHQLGCLFPKILLRHRGSILTKVCPFNQDADKKREKKAFDDETYLLSCCFSRRVVSDTLAHGEALWISKSRLPSKVLVAKIGKHKVACRCLCLCGLKSPPTLKTFHFGFIFWSSFQGSVGRVLRSPWCCCVLHN